MFPHDLFVNLSPNHLWTPTITPGIRNRLINFDVMPPQKHRHLCQIDTYTSEPYISFPILSALTPSRASTFLSNVLSNYKFGNQRNFQGHGYGQTKALYLYGSRHDGNYRSSPRFATVDLTSEDGQLKPNVRLASLGYAAKNIFQDIVVRPFNGITRLFKTTARAFDWDNDY